MATRRHRWYGSTFLTDLAGSVDLSLKGNAAIVDGRLVLDGSGDYAESDSNISSFGSNSFSVRFLINTSDTSGPRIFACRSGNGIDINFRDAAGHFGTYCKDVNGNGPIASSIVSNTAIADGVDHEVVVVVDRSNGEIRYYVDGEHDRTASHGLVDDFTPADHLFLGIFPNGSTAPLDGNFKFAEWWDGALTADEIAGLAQEGVGMFRRVIGGGVF